MFTDILCFNYKYYDRRIENKFAGKREVCYKGHTIGLWEMELFTLMIRIEHFNNSQVIIDTNNISAISSLFVVL